MENTDKLSQSGSEAAQWYVAVGEESVGPLTTFEVQRRIDAGELTWAHYAWSEGLADWKRLSELKEFQPKKPKVAPPTKAPVVKPAAKKATPGPAKKTWYLHYNDSQYGPFAESEIFRYLEVGKIHGRVHAWKDGLNEWTRLEKIDIFAEAAKEANKLREARKKKKEQDAEGAPAGANVPPSPEQTRMDRGQPDQRLSSRRPLVARILMSNNESVAVGLCRDISVGGMQVLTDQVPGIRGAKIKLNISPAGEKNLKPFVAEGTIVRILEDGRGFSFRFERLSEEAKKSIEEFITISG